VGWAGGGELVLGRGPRHWQRGLGGRRCRRVQRLRRGAAASMGAALLCRAAQRLRCGCRGAGAATTGPWARQRCLGLLQRRALGGVQRSTARQASPFFNKQQKRGGARRVWVRDVGCVRVCACVCKGPAAAGCLTLAPMPSKPVTDCCEPLRCCGISSEGPKALAALVGLGSEGGGSLTGWLAAAAAAGCSGTSSRLGLRRSCEPKPEPETACADAAAAGAGPGPAAGGKGAGAAAAAAGALAGERVGSAPALPSPEEAGAAAAAAVGVELPLAVLADAGGGGMGGGGGGGGGGGRCRCDAGCGSFRAVLPSTPAAALR
jgi:hypothetical protein